MKLKNKFFAFLFFLFTCASIYAATSNSEKEFELNAFSRIEASGGYEIILVQGDRHYVKISGNEKLLEATNISASNGKLIIKRKKNSDKLFKKNKNNIEIYVEFKDIDNMSVSGAINLTADKELTVNDLKIKISGASKINFAKIIANDIAINCSGASNIKLDVYANSIKSKTSGASKIELTGEVENQSINLSGASHYKATDLVGQTAQMDVSGASNIKLNIKQEMDVRISGASSLTYKGNASITNIKISGASSIKKLNKKGLLMLKN